MELESESVEWGRSLFRVPGRLPVLLPHGLGRDDLEERPAAELAGDEAQRAPQAKGNQPGSRSRQTGRLQRVDRPRPSGSVEDLAEPDEHPR
ncbi:MAG: hypothetical protein V3U38_01915 [Gemmatimonadota bacterium]